MKVRYETAGDTVAVRRVTLTRFACFPRKTTSDANSSPIFRTWRLRIDVQEVWRRCFPNILQSRNWQISCLPINDVER
jgi:hypothetical protein